MSISNPYAAPVAPKGKSAAKGGVGSGGAIEPLQGTRPWVIFFGILGLIFSIMILALGILILILGIGAVSSGQATESGEKLTMWHVILPVSMLIGTAALYGFPSYLLINYGIKIGKFLASANSANLHEALNQQKRFWQFLGIMTLILFGFYIVLFAVAFILGVSMTLASG